MPQIDWVDYEHLKFDYKSIDVTRDMIVDDDLDPLELPLGFVEHRNQVLKQMCKSLGIPYSLIVG